MLSPPPIKDLFIFTNCVSTDWSKIPKTTGISSYSAFNSKSVVHDEVNNAAALSTEKRNKLIMRFI